MSRPPEAKSFDSVSLPPVSSAIGNLDRDAAALPEPSVSKAATVTVVARNSLRVFIEGHFSSQDRAGNGSRQISATSPLPIKDQLLIAPVRATGRHGLVCQAVLDILSVAVIVGRIRHIRVVVEQNVMLVHVVDINLPK
jgi:hypothetical protein